MNSYEQDLTQETNDFFGIEFIDIPPSEQEEKEEIFGNGTHSKILIGLKTYKNDAHKKLQEFKMDPTDSESPSETEDGMSCENNSYQNIANPAPKVKKESKKVRQENAEFWPCVDILVTVHHECIFDVKKFSELNQVQKEVILSYLQKILTKERLSELKIYLSKDSANSSNSVVFKSNDFSIKKSRIDEVLKLVTSQALKKLYHNFMKSNGINKSFNPKKYTKRAEINRLIYLYYFKTEPVRDEHMKLFLIKNGVTREWFQGAVGGVKKNPAFIEDLLKILNDDKFHHFYKSKIDSMIRRILGVVEYAEEEELLNNESEKANKIKNKLQGGSDPAKAKKPKLPCHKYLFKQCILNTRQKIEELATEKQIKLSHKNS
jgi:hypothetical protein